MEPAPHCVADLDLDALRPKGAGFPSPESWEDETLYFLLVDRFSDGRERTHDRPQGTTPLARREDRGNAAATDEGAARWRRAGQGFVGGTLRGIASKVGYLKRLGVTALWISPVLKQAPSAETYHGYATQDFLRIEPRFGTAEDLRDLATAAHREGLRLILDIVLNHAGNVFSYESPGEWNGEAHPVRGWNDAQGRPTIPFERIATDDRDAAVWPVELQDPAAFHRQGAIADWDRDPEFRDGDFFDLKDIDLGTGGLDDYRPSPALRALTEVYKGWIAYADLDGFRIDTVKHMDPGAVRFFVREIRRFARGLGKRDFFLVGEVTGGRGFALDVARKTGLDAALGICGEPTLLAEAARGEAPPTAFFDLFAPDAEEGDPGCGHTVKVIDDHDQVCRGEAKARFAADPVGARLGLAAFALNALTLGVPCVYYGSEQGFDGHGEGEDADRFIRESMFGGEFGAFGSRGVHFFDETSPEFRGLAALLNLRKEEPALRRGAQFLREVSGDGETFGLPEPQGDAPMRSVVAWSRVHEGREVVVAINTDPDTATSAWVTIDGSLHGEGDVLKCLYCPGDESPCRVRVEARNGLAIRVTLPPGGVAVYR